jgi:putative ABC transport system substrate-binding protein
MTIARRDFITLLGGAAAVWPLAAHAQQPKMPVIGYLSLGAPAQSDAAVSAFRKGLSEMGYVEGRNLAIEFRWGRNDNGRMPELAADLVRRQVAVIAAGGTAASLAAKALTSTIPIVFTVGNDPVQYGIVASLNRPGGNVTGINIEDSELGAKRLGLLHALLPRAERFAALMNPVSPNARNEIADLQAAAAAIGHQQVEVFFAGTNTEIDTAFAGLVRKRAEALLVRPQTLFNDRHAQILALATRHAVPTMYGRRADVEAGGLMSYGQNASDPPRQLGIYVGRILKGEKPGDLPVVRSTKFELVINLQAAKLLGIDVPPTLIAIADEVIE